MDNLFNEIYQELAVLEPGKEYVLHVEAYDSGTHLAGWHERRTVQSANDKPTVDTTDAAKSLASGGALKYHEQCRWYEYDVYLPMMGADTAETPETLAEVKTMVDEIVPKVSDTSPLADWVQDGTVLYVDTSATPDTSLIYQMGRLSLDTLTHPGTIGGIIRKELKWGGLIWGNAIRKTDDVAMLQEKSVGMIGFNAIFETPALIVHMMGIPADFSATEWVAETTFFPIGQRFERQRFNAPRENKLTGALSILPSTENDARRWFTAWRTTGERQLVQKKLRTTRYYQHIIIRDGSMVPKVLQNTDEVV